MRRTWAVIGSAILMVAACACSDAAIPHSDLRDTQQMMDRYVQALQRGDFEAAMSERCSGAQIEQADKDLFMQQAGVLLASATGVVVTAPTTRIEPEVATSESIQFDFTVTIGGATTQPLHGVAITEQDHVRFCGSAQPDIVRMTDVLSRPLTSGKAFAGRIEGLMPDAVPSGYVVDQDKALGNPGTDPSWIASQLRTWSRLPLGGARMIAMQFATEVSSERALTAAMMQLAGDATETFDIPGLPNAVGVRHGAITWSMVQPPNTGYQCDQVFMLYGISGVWLTVCSLQPGDSHAVVEQFAQAVDALVRAPTSSR